MPTPAELLATDAETLRGIGMSYAKGRYLHDLAARLEDGRLDLDRLRTLDDDAARAALTEVKGVGRFTADGVLMLSLRRPDVWPAADLAFRRAVERVWELEPPASIEQVDALGERFRPWRTLAAAYLYARRRNMSWKTSLVRAVRDPAASWNLGRNRDPRNTNVDDGTNNFEGRAHSDGRDGDRSSGRLRSWPDGAGSSSGRSGTRSHDGRGRDSGSAPRSADGCAQRDARTRLHADAVGPDSQPRSRLGAFTSELGELGAEQRSGRPRPSRLYH